MLDRLDDLQQRECDQSVADHDSKDASALQLGDQIFDGQARPCGARLIQHILTGPLVANAAAGLFHAGCLHRLFRNFRLPVFTLGSPDDSYGSMATPFASSNLAALGLSLGSSWLYISIRSARSFWVI